MPNLKKVSAKPSTERFSDFNVHSLEDNSAFFHMCDDFERYLMEQAEA